MQVSDQIIEVLDYLCNKIGISIDWTSENILPYIQTLCEKYIRWEIATSIIWFLIGFILFIISIKLFKKYQFNIEKYNKYFEDSKNYNKYKDYDEKAFICIFLGVIFFLISCPFIFSNIFNIIKCICIPELKIFEDLQYYLNTIK